MSKRGWLVAMGLCVQSLAGAQDRAPPATPQEPSSQGEPPSAPAQGPPPRAPPPPREGQAIYPLQAPPAPNGVARGYGTDPYAVDPDALPGTRGPDSYRLSMYQKYSLKIDLLAEVPIPITDDNDSSNVGFGISSLFGWDLGFLLPTLGAGLSWSNLNLPPGYRDDGRRLKRVHLDLGLMAEFENKSIVTPVIGALLDFNFWHVAGDDSIVCGGYYWGCYEVEDYHYTTGFTFRAGIDVRFFRNDRFSLGTGVLPQVTLQGGPFTQAEWWISPYALFTVRN